MAEHSPTGAPRGSRSTHLEAIFDCLREAYEAGVDGRAERAAVLEASRSLRGYARLVQIAASQKTRGRPWFVYAIPPAFARLQLEYDRLVAARAQGGRAEQERADFLEAVATVRHEAQAIRKDACAQARAADARLGR